MNIPYLRRNYRQSPILRLFSTDPRGPPLPRIREHQSHRHEVSHNAPSHRRKQAVLSFLILIILFLSIQLINRWSHSEETAHAAPILISYKDSSSRSVDSVPLIPRRIYLTHKHDLCATKTASHIQRETALFDPQYLSLVLNVERIKAFNPEFEVECFDDEKAYRSLLEVDPKFAAYFKKERKGMYKADIFRIVMLYYYGGYYFDADMEPMESISPLLDKDVTFTSSLSAGGDALFQSFLGSTRFNEILKLNMEIFDEFYGENKAMPYNMGTFFLSEALKQFTAENELRTIQNHRKYQNQNIQLFQEQPFAGHDAADIIQRRRQIAPRNMKDIVQFAVYDPKSGKYPFWSRIADYQREW